MSTDSFFVYNNSFYSYLSASTTYGFLLLLSIWGIKRYRSGFIFFIAVLTSLIWSVYTCYILLYTNSYRYNILPFEALRNLAWFIYLLSMLARLEEKPEQNTTGKINHYFKATFLYHSNYSIILIIGTIFVFISELNTELTLILNHITGMNFQLFLHVCFAIIGLMLIEQLYRNTLPEQRWAIKFICLGLGALFAYDFMIYSKSLLFTTLDFTLWSSRGFVHALIVPVLAISVVRLQNTSQNYTVSRKVIFHTTTLVGTGLYLVFMSLAGFYIKAYGGSWGDVAQKVFIFLALLLLIALMFSGSIRAKFKLYFNKHFFHYRYDYREEWLNLSTNLAQLDSLNHLSYLIIKTLADLVDSSSGGLWIKNEQSNYYLAETYHLTFNDKDLELINYHTESIQFLEKKQLVIDLCEYNNDPEIYEQIDLTCWTKHKKDIWLLIPLLQQNKLIAFVALAKPRVIRQLNWEDHDMLKTVSMQLANAFALKQTSDELSTARQFEAYSRLSAFVIHDLKNLVAQVSLLVKNAEKHKNNPEFIDDAMATLENVVDKMQKLVSQLRQRNIPDIRSQFDLLTVAKDIVKQQSSQHPIPQLITTLKECIIHGEQEKIATVLGHLVQNAQDATKSNGSIIIELTKGKSKGKGKESAIIKVIDTGSGMDEKFIAERLFKPFDTTKGNAGMGIGVYETKSYILKHSGSISVTSKVAHGTQFTIQLPLLS